MNDDYGSRHGRRRSWSRRTSMHDLELLHEMLRIRRFEEKSAELYTLGKIRGFLHLYIGEEAVAVGAPAGADAGRCDCFDVSRTWPRPGPRHSGRGHHGRDVRQGQRLQSRSGRLHAPLRRRAGDSTAAMPSWEAGLPVAVGLALADKMQNNDRVTACFFGDGAVAEGEFHESLNLAALWKLPVLFVCENNLLCHGHSRDPPPIADRHSPEGARLRRPRRGGGRHGRARRRGGQHDAAVERYAQGVGPSCWRRGPIASAHSMYDAELYRTKDEVEQWKKRDPMRSSSTRLREDGMLTAARADIGANVSAEIDEAVAFAEAGPGSRLQDLMKDVYTPRIAMLTSDPTVMPIRAACEMPCRSDRRASF